MRPFGPGRVDDDLELLLEPAVAGGGRRAALEAEGGHGHLPAVVDAADHVLLRAAGVGEEHLVELGGRRRSAGSCAPRSPACFIGHEQVGDARRASARRDRCGPARRCSRRLKPWVVQIFWPLMTHSSPSRTASVLSDGQVRAGVGLAEALAPGDLAGEDLGQEELLLLLGAPLQDGRARPACRRRSRPAAARRPGRTPRSARPPPWSTGPCRRTPPARWRRSSRPRTASGSTPSWNCTLASPSSSKPGSNQPSGRCSSSHGADLDAEGFGFGRIGQVHALILTSTLTSRSSRGRYQRVDALGREERRQEGSERDRAAGTAKRRRRTSWSLPFSGRPASAALATRRSGRSRLFAGSELTEGIRSAPMEPSGSRTGDASIGRIRRRSVQRITALASATAGHHGRARRQPLVTNSGNQLVERISASGASRRARPNHVVGGIAPARSASLPPDRQTAGVAFGSRRRSISRSPIPASSVSGRHARTEGDSVHRHERPRGWPAEAIDFFDGLEDGMHIVAGRDGNLRMSDYFQIDRVTPEGRVTTRHGSRCPAGIAAGPTATSGTPRPRRAGSDEFGDGDHQDLLRPERRQSTAIASARTATSGSPRDEQHHRAHHRRRGDPKVSARASASPTASRRARTGTSGSPLRRNSIGRVTPTGRRSSTTTNPDVLATELAAGALAS